MKLRLTGLKNMLGARILGARILGAGVVTALLVACPLEARAGVWNLDERFSEEAATEEMERFLMEAADSASPENPVSYLSEVYEAIFEPDAVKIPFQYVRETAEGSEVLQSGTMYYSQGDLFILNDSSDSSPLNIATWGTNFATVDGELYAWSPEETTGLQLTRFQGDTIELLDYWIDPAMLMRFTYLDYQQTPENFEVIEVGEETYLQRKEATYGFAGMRIEDSPHWMSALVTLSCREETCPSTGETFTVEIDRPVPIEAIPEEVRTLPSEVTFEPSEQTADSYLIYL